MGLFGAVAGEATVFVFFSLLSGHIVTPPAVLILGQILVYVFVVISVSFLFTRKRPPWLRTSDAASRSPAAAPIRSSYRGRPSRLSGIAGPDP